jgi:hypothetical protein
MRSTWKHWKEAENALLARLISEGLRPAEMAEKIQGRTESAIYNRIYKRQEFLDAYRAASDKRERGPMLYTKEEIRSIADDNRIWVGLIAAVRVSAICSFSTLVLLALAIFFL